MGSEMCIRDSVYPDDTVTALAFDPASSRLVTAGGDEFDPTSGGHRLSLWEIDDPTSPTRTDLADDLLSVGAVSYTHLTLPTIYSV